MGNYCCPERIKRNKLALLLVGLDNAGKTVAAKGLAGEPVDHYPIPTIGFSVIELQHQQYDIKIFDLGGSPNIRGIWYKYFVDVHGVIFVVDSCDSDRFKEVKDVLEEMLSNDKIAGKPLLILANKQDRESALDEIDIIECLNIEQLVNRFKCPTLVQSCSANDYNKSDPGIQTGYDWLLSYIDKNYEQLNLRVQMDVMEQEIIEKKEMLQKIQRIKAEREALSNNEDPDAIQTFTEYVSKMNGDAVKVDEPNNYNLIDFYPNPEESLEVNNSTSDSSITFPEIYPVNEYNTQSTDIERPRSAIQVVRHQLQMNNVPKRSQSAKTRRNKTAPSVRAKEFLPTDRVFIISKPSLGPGGDGFPLFNVREKLEIDERFEVKKLPPLKVRSRAQINRENDMNGVCIVDIE
ncbi:unnamed protein product [Ceutorhynchus assimilis]|uniref:ADP-ribosylation factor-like protein 13B n=1 Tax=Ceutorhynchus assimilis TaxID=467358 RepID=A0A9N9QQY6_9CUCU|nr:unnamed protein product [Ceutorhynchus assimilis]